MGSTGRKVEMAPRTRVHAGAAAGSGCLTSDPLLNGVSTYWTSHDAYRYLSCSQNAINIHARQGEYYPMRGKEEKVKIAA